MICLRRKNNPLCLLLTHYRHASKYALPCFDFFSPLPPACFRMVNRRIWRTAELVQHTPRRSSKRATDKSIGLPALQALPGTRTSRLNESSGPPSPSLPSDCLTRPHDAMLLTIRMQTGDPGGTRAGGGVMFGSIAAIGLCVRKRGQTTRTKIQLHCKNPSKIIF